MPTIIEGELIRQSITEGDCHTYGVRLCAEDGSVVMLPDVDPHRPRAERFLQRVIGEEADETQLWYLLEDFLGEEYTRRV